MKRPLFFLFLFSICSSILAQHNFISPYIERTPIITNVGFSLGRLINAKLELGAFYQKHIDNTPASELVMPRYDENTFYGVYGEVPIYYYEGRYLYLNTRIGLLDDEKILVAPSIRHQFEITKHLMLNVGLGGASLGVKNFRPTMIGGLKFQY